MIEGEEFIKSLSHTNDRRFVILKAAEELNELATVLIQSVTKPQQTSEAILIAEIADVEIQLIALKELLQLSPDVLDYVKTSKINKLKLYKDVIPNFGQI